MTSAINKLKVYIFEHDSRPDVANVTVYAVNKEAALRKFIPPTRTLRRNFKCSLQKDISNNTGESLVVKHQS